MRWFRENRRVKVFIYLLVLFGISLWVRLVHFRTLYPYFLYQDELRQTKISLKILKEKTLEPDFYLYPHLTFYLNAGAFAGYFLLKNLPEILKARSLKPLKVFIANFDPASWKAIRLARLLALVFGLACLFGFWLLARLLLGEDWGFFASLIFSLLPLSVTFSYLAKVDIFMLCFCVFSLYFQVLLIREGRLRDFLLASFFAGLALDTKINFFPFLSLFFALLIRARLEGASFKKWIKDRRIWLAGAVGILSSFIFSPLYYLHFDRALEMIGWMYFLGELNSFYHIDPHSFWLDKYSYGLVVILPFILGYPVYLVSLAGALERIIKVDFKEWFLMLVNIVAFTYTFMSQTDSYLIYLFMYVMMFYVLFCAQATRWIWQRGRKRSAFVLAGILLFICLLRSQNFYAISFRAFDQSGRWLAELPAKTRVLAYSVYLPGPRLSHLNYVRAWPQNLDLKPIKKFNPDYILIYLSDFAGFEKFYRHLPIAQRLKKLLNGKWEFKVIFEYEVFYPEDFIFKWLDKEFVIKLLILKRTPAK